MTTGTVHPAARGGAGFALTFDDGPDPRGTPMVLDALAEVGAQATFFVIAPHAERHPELLSRILESGHHVGLHCDQHVRHCDRDRAWVAADTERALGRLDRLGVLPSLWRTPWGVTADWTPALGDAYGLQLVGWDVDTHDWRGDPAPAMFAATRDELRDGSIVLAHDGIGPGALRERCTETAAYVRLAARHGAGASLQTDAAA